MLLKQQLIVHDNVLLYKKDFDWYQVFLNVARYLKVEQVLEDLLDYYCLLLILVIFLNNLIPLKNLNNCH
jgi:hypothetical protein